MVIMLTRSLVQRPVLDRCSTVRRPEVAVAAEPPDDCSFRRNAVTATTGSISRTGSQRSRAGTTAPLLAATSVHRARSSPSALIMRAGGSPARRPATRLGPRQFSQQENVGRAHSFSLRALGGVASTSTTNARSALLPWSGASAAIRPRTLARPAARRYRPGSPRPSQRHRQPHRPRHTAKERTVLDHDHVLAQATLPRPCTCGREPRAPLVTTSPSGNSATRLRGLGHRYGRIIL